MSFVRTGTIFLEPNANDTIWAELRRGGYTANELATYPEIFAFSFMHSCINDPRRVRPDQPVVVPHHESMLDVVRYVRSRAEFYIDAVAKVDYGVDRWRRLYSQQTDGDNPAKDGLAPTAAGVGPRRPAQRRATAARTRAPTNGTATNGAKPDLPALNLTEANKEKWWPTLFEGANKQLGQGILEFAWDPNTEPDLDGYRIYWGDASRTYSVSHDVGNVTTAALRNLPYGPKYFAATAYDTEGLESDYSNELSAVIR